MHSSFQRNAWRGTIPEDRRSLISSLRITYEERYTPEESIDMWRLKKQLTKSNSPTEFVSGFWVAAGLHPDETKEIDHE